MTDERIYREFDGLVEALSMIECGEADNPRAFARSALLSVAMVTPLAQKTADYLSKARSQPIPEGGEK